MKQKNKKQTDILEKVKEILDKKKKTKSVGQKLYWIFLSQQVWFRVKKLIKALS